MLNRPFSKFFHINHQIPMFLSMQKFVFNNSSYVTFWLRVLSVYDQNHEKQFFFLFFFLFWSQKHKYWRPPFLRFWDCTVPVLHVFLAIQHPLPTLEWSPIQVLTSNHDPSCIVTSVFLRELLVFPTWYSCS